MTTTSYLVLAGAVSELANGFDKVDRLLESHGLPKANARDVHLGPLNDAVVEVSDDSADPLLVAATLELWCQLADDVAEAIYEQMPSHMKVKPGGPFGLVSSIASQIVAPAYETTMELRDSVIAPLLSSRGWRGAQ